jgi:hypothetical protein
VVELAAAACPPRNDATGRASENRSMMATIGRIAVRGTTCNTGFSFNIETATGEARDRLPEAPGDGIHLLAEGTQQCNDLLSPHTVPPPRYLSVTRPGRCRAEQHHRARRLSTRSALPRYRPQISLAATETLRGGGLGYCPSVDPLSLTPNWAISSLERPASRRG